MSTTPPLDANRAPPSKTGIWVGGILIVAAVVAFGVLLFVGLTGLFRDVGNYDRLEPGSSVVLDLQPGTYLIFSEGTSSSQVAVVGEDGPLQFEKPSGRSSFRADGSQWTAGLSFEVANAGAYEISSQGPGRIAVGPPFGRKIAIAVLGPFAVAFIIGGIGSALFLTTASRRRRAKAYSAVFDSAG